MHQAILRRERPFSDWLFDAAGELRPSCFVLRKRQDITARRHNCKAGRSIRFSSRTSSLLLSSGLLVLLFHLHSSSCLFGLLCFNTRCSSSNSHPTLFFWTSILVPPFLAVQSHFSFSITGSILAPGLLTEFLLPTCLRQSLLHCTCLHNAVVRSFFTACAHHRHWHSHCPLRALCWRELQGHHIFPYCRTRWHRQQRRQTELGVRTRTFLTGEA